MSVHVDWASEEKTAILWSFVGRWTWGEVEEGNRATLTMLDTVNRHVALIIDVRHMLILPPDVISRVKTQYLEFPPTLGRMIVVGADANLRLFWDTFTKLPYAAHLKAHYFDTVEDALQFIQSENDA